MSRSKFYLVLLFACIAGYGWIAIIYFMGLNSYSNEIGGCLIKKITTIPCPSCGSTRAVLSFLKGDFGASLYWNPIGLILIIIMILSPIWILYDVITKKSTLLHFYRRTEFFLTKRWIVIIVIILVLANWIWNINKGL